MAIAALAVAASIAAVEQASTELKLFWLPTSLSDRRD